jgi:hypothetical protein
LSRFFLKPKAQKKRQLTRRCLRRYVTSGVNLKYVYALVTDEFFSEKDFYDGSPSTSYFYVGWTSDIKKRLSEHKSRARNGSDYPYHIKIRELGERWNIEVLEEVDENIKSFAEEYHMVNLTCKGHHLLNIKRGDINNVEKETVADSLSKLKINNGTEYAKLYLQNHDKKIEQRERRQIKSQLKHIQLCECGTKRLWKLGGKEYEVDRYLSKDALVEYFLPETIKEFERIKGFADQFKVTKPGV